MQKCSGHWGVSCEEHRLWSPRLWLYTEGRSPVYIWASLAPVWALVWALMWACAEVLRTNWAARAALAQHLRREIHICCGGGGTSTILQWGSLQYPRLLSFSLWPTPAWYPRGGLEGKGEWVCLMTGWLRSAQSGLSKSTLRPRRENRFLWSSGLLICFYI